MTAPTSGPMPSILDALPTEILERIAADANTISLQLASRKLFNLLATHKGRCRIVSQTFSTTALESYRLTGSTTDAGDSQAILGYRHDASLLINASWFLNAILDENDPWISLEELQAWAATEHAQEALLNPARWTQRHGDFFCSVLKLLNFKARSTSFWKPGVTSGALMKGIESALSQHCFPALTLLTGLEWQSASQELDMKDLHHIFEAKKVQDNPHKGPTPQQQDRWRKTMMDDPTVMVNTNTSQWMTVARYRLAGMCFGVRGIGRAVKLIPAGDVVTIIATVCELAQQPNLSITKSHWYTALLSNLIVSNLCTHHRAESEYLGYAQMLVDFTEMSEEPGSRLQGIRDSLGRRLIEAIGFVEVENEKTDEVEEILQSMQKALASILQDSATWRVHRGVW